MSNQLAKQVGNDRENKDGERRRGHGVVLFRFMSFSGWSSNEMWAEPISLMYSSFIEVLSYEDRFVLGSGKQYWHGKWSDTMVKSLKQNVL
jgi:hypothetical protein